MYNSIKCAGMQKNDSVGKCVLNGPAEKSIIGWNSESLINSLTIRKSQHLHSYMLAVAFAYLNDAAETNEKY